MTTTVATKPAVKLYSVEYYTEMLTGFTGQHLYELALDLIGNALDSSDRARLTQARNVLAAVELVRAQRQAACQ